MADDIVSSVALRPEAASALSRAHRSGRITTAQRSRLLDSLANLTDQVHLVVLDDGLSRQAADLAVANGLRGYDAVHAATALTVLDEDGLAASGDTLLLAAWRAGELTTCDVSAVAT